MCPSQRHLEGDEVVSWQLVEWMNMDEIGGVQVSWNENIQIEMIKRIMYDT